jgi:REP element-mobilizing transposase RayT
MAGTIGRVVQAFKSAAANEYIRGVRESGWPPFAGKLWQRNYYEHVIRGEGDLESIRDYIAGNPGRWTEDHENPARVEAQG